MSIYKTEDARQQLMRLYDEKKASLKMKIREADIVTAAGNTHVLIAGDSTLPPVILLHGINAGAPLALEAVQGIEQQYCIYAVDTIGQATRSDESRLPYDATSFGRWLAEVMDKLQIASAPVIGVSFGAYILQSLIRYAPEKVSKAIFIVPSGFVNGPVLRSITALSIPLMRYLSSRKEAHLIRFMSAFYNSIDPWSLEFQKTTLTGVRMDYRRPPLIRESEVTAFQSPVFMMVADEDVFFPGDQAVRRSRSVFRNLRDVFILKNSRHIPDVTRYPMIQEKLLTWLRPE